MYVSIYIRSYCYAGPPALTMNITKNTESSLIVVQWDEVDDPLPTTYIVTWASESERDPHNIQFETLEEQSSYTITGLTLDTVYTITVTAYNKCGTGPQYSTSVSLTTDATSSSTSTITVITNTMATTSTGSSSTSTAITKSSTITITSSIPVMNPSTTTNPITTSSVTDLKTSNTNPNAVITSTYTTTDIMSAISTTHPNDKSTADENSKILYKHQ